MNALKRKARAAWHSATAWALGLGLVLTEALPYIVESLPLARDGFDDATYQMIVRATFVLGILLRVRKS